MAEMLPGLIERGIEPSVVTLSSRSDVHQEVRRSGVSVRSLDGQGRVARVRSLRSIIRATQPDIVHTTLFESDIAGRLATARTGPVVLTSLVNTSYDPVRRHDPKVRRHKLAAARMIDGFTARHLTDHFHAITEAVKASAVRHLGIPAQRITVIERGRDPGRLGRPSAARRRNTRLRLEVAAGEKLVVNVGRQEFQKGQRYLLECMVRVLQDHPDVVVLIAGREGHASDELRRLHSRLRLGDRVRFLGHRDDVPDLLAAADLFVFPSLYEGLGGAVLEAMALGVPIVASDLPAVREITPPGRAARLVPPGDVEALARTVVRLLGDGSHRQALGRGARAIFEECFRVERSAQRMARLYRALLHGGAGKV